ncbi:MAG TPA: 50S ribosomal protein L19 [Gemmatales bacterium]|nr:50S ribosomal protein L19 [Gemmatales bacterium]HMP59614.1 50S ribosomal protein L19 [Gemmatales bacterium]
MTKSTANGQSKRGAVLALVEEKYRKPAKELKPFEIGDQVEVHQRIQEGSKERIQIFSGTVIARRGSGTREYFTVRRIVQGEGVERKFPLHSPKLARIVVKRSGRVRRAKLYYLRDRVGKATRLREGRKVIVEVLGDEGAKSTKAKQS